MKPEKKMSQEQFDEQLRREFSRADEAQKRVLDKIMSMSEEERRPLGFPDRKRRKNFSERELPHPAEMSPGALSGWLLWLPLLRSA